MSEDKFVSETPVGPRQFVNIVALFGDPTTHSRLTLACHYDSKRFDSMQFIGASDSAAACAIMIQLARCLNDSLHNALNYTARGQVGSFASIVHYSYVAVTDIKSVTRNNFYEQLVCVGDSF